MRTLSITISNELYDSLKHTIQPRQISRFVSIALEEKLSQKKEELYQAYLEASQDAEREEEAKEWEGVTLEGWASNNLKQRKRRS